MKVKIKYFNEDYPRLEKMAVGDWIDLRVDRVDYTKRTERKIHTTITNITREIDFKKDNKLEYKKGDVIKFGLGVAMQLPKGYEAEIRPRSSTFKHWGLIQTNSVGTIDNTYNGDNDEWQIEFIAMRDGIINRFDRVCQFRIQKNQPKFKFTEVERLGNDNRGGFGSTGR